MLKQKVAINVKLIEGASEALSALCYGEIRGSDKGDTGCLSRLVVLFSKHHHGDRQPVVLVEENLNGGKQHRMAKQS